MRQLYPAIEPLLQHSIPVQIPHILHVEECGRLHGIPVVFLHGGPGAGCTPTHRRFFDPDRYRIILIDQRGAGRSTPHACLEHNTTQDLVADLERVREHLKIERWLVFGGSWGSTLALAYAAMHPERVLGLILRGIFLCRDEDVDWFYQSGADRIFPDYWADYLAPIPEDERGDLVLAYRRRLVGTDELARMQAAKAWSIWEGRTATLRADPHTVDFFSDPRHALAIARIENHYFFHGAFLRDHPLLTEAKRFAHLDGEIIHGRYDVVCPINQAFDLAAVWPKARLTVIEDSGHAASEPGITDALIRATDRFAERLSAHANGRG
ncbi:prolyl aminopeptidase [Halothiobacillus sp.]|uniref:prolyl aminopeptidase n=1 Tax=Halothiobacillus sp. TaxID=1891311 RepID=UPI002AD4A66F|nr:prolyl aminopeptidase [Halothiobacillus sp.]